MTSSPAPRPAWNPVLAIAGGLTALLLVLSTRYGYHRDELYFRVAGRHLDWGYPDQPPLLPLLTRAVTAFGDVLFVQRLPAALLAGAGVVLAALTAREMGGERTAQWRTAAAYAVCPFAVATGHAFFTATLDLVLCTLLVWLAVRWTRTRQDRLLLVLGVVTGLAVNVKYLAALVVLALLAGMLTAGPRDIVRRPAFWAGALIAVASLAPSLLWQAAHGWPQLEMAGVIADRGEFGGRVGFLPFLLVLTGIVPAALWLYGVWRTPAPYRFVAWAFLLLVVFFLVTGGKPYYVAGLWGGLWAAGAVAAQRGGMPRGTGWTVGVPAFALTGLATVALTLPVYPERILAATPQPGVNPDSAETVGWPRFVAEVARVRGALPPGERERAVLLMSNYGEAGALDRYGAEHGLPRAFSPHNGYWYFGRPGDTGGPVIIVGPGEDERAALRHWSSCAVGGRIDNGADLDNQEQGKLVWVCRGQHEPWSVLWPRLKNLS